MVPILYPLRWLTFALRNLLRQTRRAPHYVHMVISGPLPDLSAPKVSWWKAFFTRRPLSLQELTARAERIAMHKSVRGVVLHLRALDLPPARVQALQSIVRGLRHSGKQVIVWASSYRRAAYQVALCADKVLLQDGGSIGVLGLRSSQLYIGDSLALAGLKLDAVQISPYKSALDRFARSDMTNEVREMHNWLLDAHFAELKADLAQGRRVAGDRAQAIIDNSPYTSARALQEGLVDAIVSEEDLPQYLSVDGKPASIWPWVKANKVLPLKPPNIPGSHIAVIRVTGSIVDGSSDKPHFKPPLPIPFLFNERAGDITIVSQARAALKNTRVKGVLLYVDSSGGSATASEAMYAALAKLAAKKPLVAVMGATAASGGYYVTTAAHWVVARPGTVTGSIGVLTGKVVDGALLEKLLARRIVQKRGDSAELDLPSRPYTEEERKLEWASIAAIYDLFLRRVASARKSTPEAIDRIGGGRVWTGSQALQHGLIDELGGLNEALAKIRSMAGLPATVGLREVPAESAQAPLPESLSALSYAYESVKLFGEAGLHLICPLSLE